MATTRTFSFRAEEDFGERHDRALAELDRLRRERPLLAESVRHDFDVRLAFLAGSAAPPLGPAGRLSALKLVELRQALAWTFSLAG